MCVTDALSDAVGVKPPDFSWVSDARIGHLNPFFLATKPATRAPPPSPRTNPSSRGMAWLCLCHIVWAWQALAGLARDHPASTREGHNRDDASNFRMPIVHHVQYIQSQMVPPHDLTPCVSRAGEEKPATKIRKSYDVRHSSAWAASHEAIPPPPASTHNFFRGGAGGRGKGEPDMPW